MANGNGTTTTQAPAKQESQLAMMKRTVVDVVAAKARRFIESGELTLPRDYEVNNALKSAWLILQTVEDKDHNKALSVCTTDSIANSLLDMIVQGLNPIKKQGYFIAYGKQLTFQRSYFGSMAVAKMVNKKVDDFAFAVVYAGDTFRYGIKNGKKMVTEHEQEIGNVDKAKIVAAYCMALDADGNPYRTEIMTFDEIKQAWKQSKMSPILNDGSVKLDSTHGKFTADMALKTVINKCCKAIINSSSDNALLLDRVNRNEELSDRAAVEAEIEEAADKGPIIEIEARAEESETEINLPPPQTETAHQEERRVPGF